jgi:hypothetical protein
VGVGAVPMRILAAGGTMTEARKIAVNPDSAAAPEAERRSAANRANAQHSTGPRTPEGKARSAQNALKHGLFAGSVTICSQLLGEQDAEFAALLGDLQDEMHPEGRQEGIIVERVAALWWRLARLQTYAQGKLAGKLSEFEDEFAAVFESEKIGPAEARLERALSRLNKDFAFLQRYRRAGPDGPSPRPRRPSAHQAAAAIAAQIEAETHALMLDARRRRELAEAGQVVASVGAPGASAHEADEADATDSDSSDGTASAEPAQVPPFGGGTVAPATRERSPVRSALSDEIAGTNPSRPR